MAERNRIKSSIDALPEEARALLDTRLADVNYTYQDITDELNEQGYDISRSAIGRYALRHNRVARRLREAQEQTNVLLQAVRENRDIETTEMATAIFMDGLARRIATAEEDFDNLSMDKAGRLLVSLQRSAVYKERYRNGRLKGIEATEQNILERMRKSIQNNPALLSELEAIVHEAAQEEATRDEG